MGFERGSGEMYVSVLFFSKKKKPFLLMRKPKERKQFLSGRKKDEATQVLGIL